MVGLDTGGICRDRHRKGGTRNRRGQAGASPRIGDVLTGQTLVVGVHRNHITGADIILGALHLEISTELIDGEVGSGLTAGSGSGSQSIITGSVCINRSTSCRGSIGLSPSVGIETGGSRKGIVRLSIANHVASVDGKFRSVLNRDSLVVGRERGAVIVVIDGFHHNIVGTRVGKGGREGITGSSTSEFAVNIPFVGQGTQREHGSCSCAQLQRVGHGKGNRSIGTHRSGRSRHGHIASEFNIRNSSSIKDSGLGGTFHRVIHRFHFPAVGQKSGVHSKNVLGGGGVKGLALVPLVAHRVGTGGVADRCHQVVSGGGGAGVGRTSQRDGEIHHRVRVNRGHDKDAVLGRDLHNKLVRLAVIKTVLGIRNELISLFIVRAGRGLSVQFPEVGNLSVHRTVNHRSEGDRLIGATRFIAHNRDCEHGVISRGDIRRGCRHAGRCQKRLIGRWGNPTEQLQFPVVGMGCFAACLACSQVEERH